MRGSVWTVVVLAVGLAMLPLILDFGDAEGSLTADLFGIIAVFDGILGLLVLVAAMAAFVAYFQSDGF
ncbi:uncharacterized protein NP_7018A (plasmid) [Natronomonas pharaonis DSM 2160]|uniref:Uncharacterized protein n=1 Tax=Natronomonas pharaonis (strain ATCC 35678 / DSM 2160 / CIP 103997 / JCM 8858 / NBRC 14720 / NCIMB 2260 / Gabara) TaxID=348780 RepID=Q3ILU5_NATPD|nr:hypothetical protein [Natronomonas pharaonis]CAI49738.1 uncharacterized protein NP_3294A [Natronomonas pharaonis DSM 2160]CAI50925.1 uncharacterized protein NP_7018A [Natronomonas pharaonis DSM 2160]